jgi:hypothetical protein
MLSFLKTPLAELKPGGPTESPLPRNTRRGLRSSVPPRDSAMAVDSDEWLVPTSQSQDLKPFFISPPRPGGTVLLKDTTPKPLRQSQGYMNQPSQPLPSILATIQTSSHTITRETDAVVTSQIDEAELRLPHSVQAGPSRAPAFSSPSNSPTRHNDDDPLTSPLLPSSLLPSTDPNRSSRGDAALDFVQYQATPTTRKYSIDSPNKDFKFFESQTTLSPAWSQPRSFERWRLRDLLDSQHAFGDGKAGLEAEAEGREPGEGLKTTDGEESEELENAATMASSITQAESQDLTEWFLRVHPELKFGGKAPPYKSSPSSLRSSKSDSDSAKPNGNESGSGSRVEQVEIINIEDTPPSSQNSKKSGHPDPITSRIENMGMMSPVKAPSSLTESESQSGSPRKAQDGDESQGGSLGESALAFSQPTLDPLMVFLDMFEGGDSVPRDSQSVINVDD